MIADLRLFSVQLVMISLLRKSIFSFNRHKWSDAFKSFLQFDAGASVRRERHQKDRKYINVEITEQFKQQEQRRKQQRLLQVKQRKRILQQKISIESKLLTAEENKELENINNQVQSLQQLLDAQEKELAVVEAKLEETQADFILIEGHKKLVILNQIEYLKHMNYHPSGLVLSPQIMEMIENVHYLVNNNLPVNKYKIYQLMPDLFEAQIGQLDQSIRRLIQQKKLDPLSDPSGRIRFFSKKTTSRFRDDEQDILDLQQQARDVFSNMEKQIVRMLEPHESYLIMVNRGQTVFRNASHMVNVMLSDTLNLKFTPEQEALRKTIHDVMELRRKFEIYNDEVNQKCIEMRYSYIEPPEYILNHPALIKMYEKAMKAYTSATDYRQFLPQYPVVDDGRAYLEEKLTNLVIEKYHPRIEKLWNEGKRQELIATKKQLEIQFYNDSTKIYEEYQQLLAEEKEKQQFLKIPKKPRELQNPKHTRISLDDITKTIYVNNSNPQKYNLAFFTEYLGFENVEEARRLFNTFSYLRVFDQGEKEVKKIEFEIIKFREL